MRREVREGREILASALARDGFRQAACTGLWQVWAEGEKQLRDPHHSGLEAVAAMSQICASCPARTMTLCREWALVERYTGFAAGTTWVEGKADEMLPAARDTSGRRGKINDKRAQAC